MTNITVPFIDLTQRYEEERAELLACVERVLSLGHLVLTEEVQRFEQAVCAYTGARHCIGLNSGTDALMMALWAAGIGKGDEVIVPPVSFVATAGAVAHVGATPVFCDVDATQTLDPTLIEARITPRTKAIMPVHWTGRMANMPAIQAIADKHGLVIIEDSAQSMGSYLNGKHGGTFGLAGAISCHPLKNLNALGDGGMLLTDDDEIARKVRLYRNHGLEARDSVAFFGVNSRLDALSAEVLSYRLTRLDDIIARRRHNANLYRSNIRARQITIPAETADRQDSYVMFLVFAQDRDGLKAHLDAAGIQSLVYYATPLHLHKASAYLGYKAGDFPVAEQQCADVLALPHHQNLTEAQVLQVCDAINSYYGV
jgi:dTDP-4-amino-4,6-dideoxygalactose transaminase